MPVLKSKRKNIFIGILIAGLFASWLMIFVEEIVHQKQLDKLKPTTEEIGIREQEIVDIKDAAFLEGKMVGIDEGIASTKNGTLFQPTTLLTPRQEKLCTTLAAYGETRNSNLDDAAKIIFVVINRTEASNNDGVQRSSCSVLHEGRGSQFEGVRPYLKAIENIVWGNGYDYVPKSARTEGTPNATAWANLNKLVDEIYDGKHPRATVATHFVNLQGLKGEVKSWIRDLKPVGVSSNHFLLIDYEIRDGKRVKFTKQKPYRVRSKWGK